MQINQTNLRQAIKMAMHANTVKMFPVFVLIHTVWKIFIEEMYIDKDNQEDIFAMYFLLLPMLKKYYCLKFL